MVTRQASDDGAVVNRVVEIARLRPHPGNYKKHGDGQVRELRRSLRKFGQPRSIVVQAPGDDGGEFLIVAGHGVVMAARAEGWAELRCDVLPAGWPAAKVKAYLAADNELATLSETDDALLAGLVAEVQGFDAELASLAAGSEERLRELLAAGGAANGEDPGPLVDKAEELQAKWGVQPGDLWELGAHRLVCGDCTDKATVERVMGGEKAKLVVTSPPYSGADMWNDMGAVSEIERVGLDALRLSVQFTDEGCPLLWNIANTPIGTQAGVVHTTTTTKVAADELGLLCYGEIVWAKPVQHLTPLAFMMRPVVPNLIHEYVMIFYKGKRKQRESSSGLTDEDKAIRTKSVWELSPESAQEIGHKAPFPFELARRCVALWSLGGDIVLEPFLGSGTTLIACERLGRRCRAIEIVPKYVAVALERWATMTGQTPVLLPAQGQIAGEGAQGQ